MRKAFIILGIYFLVVMVGMSTFFILKFDQARKEKVPEPNIGKEPEEPQKPYIGPTLSPYMGVRVDPQLEQAKAINNQAEAQAYEAAVNKYNKELEAYTQNKIAEENRYQQALNNRDSRARSYLLYMVILDSVLAVLTFLSFLVASRTKGEASVSVSE